MSRPEPVIDPIIEEFETALLVVNRNDPQIDLQVLINFFSQFTSAPNRFIHWIGRRPDMIINTVQRAITDNNPLLRNNMNKLNLQTGLKKYIETISPTSNRINSYMQRKLEALNAVHESLKNYKAPRAGGGKSRSRRRTTMRKQARTCRR
jgi:hypothetical protein